MTRGGVKLNGGLRKRHVLLALLLLVFLTSQVASALDIHAPGHEDHHDCCAACHAGHQPALHGVTLQAPDPLHYAGPAALETRVAAGLTGVTCFNSSRAPPAVPAY